MFGIRLEKSPVGNTGLAEEQKEFPAVVEVRSPPDSDWGCFCALDSPITLPGLVIPSNTQSHRLALEPDDPLPSRNASDKKTDIV